MLNEKIIFAGFGGQGLMFLGKLLAFSLMNEGKNVSYIPSYGPEMRGGTANCKVRLSDNEIASPLVEKPTIVVAMNTPSFEKFGQIVEPEGIVLVNSSLVKTDQVDKKIIAIPASDLANKMGNIKIANMIILGALIYKKPQIISVENLLKNLKIFLSTKANSLYEINEKAFIKGYEYFKN